MIRSYTKILQLLTHNPKSEPKFHHVLIFDGESKSINALFTIFTTEIIDII